MDQEVFRKYVAAVSDIKVTVCLLRPRTSRRVVQPSSASFKRSEASSSARALVSCSVMSRAIFEAPMMCPFGTFDW